MPKPYNHLSLMFIIIILAHTQIAKLSLSSDYRIQQIEEFVDVSKTPLNRIKIILSGVSPELLEEFKKPGALDAKCSEISPIYVKDCKHMLYEDSIEFDIITLKDLITISQGFRPDEPIPELSFRYTPLNFLVADETESVGKRTLSYNLPTFGLIVDELNNKRDSRIDFFLQCPDATDSCYVHEELETEFDSYRIGDVINIPLHAVDFAAWALFDKTGSQFKSRQYVCFNCSAIELPISFDELGCSSTPEKMCSSDDYNIVAIYMRKGDRNRIYISSKTVEINPAFFPVDVYISRGEGGLDDMFFRGETIVVGVGAATSIGSCSIELYHNGELIYQLKELPRCLYVPIETSTDWPIGKYILRATVINKYGIAGYATYPFFLISSGNDFPVPVAVDKISYMAGDSVGLFINTPGETCSVELLNYTGLEVRSIVTKSFPCGNLKFDLPENLPPGTYQLRVRVYRGNEYGTHLTTIRVEPWIPKSHRGSDLQRLCTDRRLIVDSISIPCIGPEVHCSPTTEQYPICLCFDEDGGLRDVCESGDICTGNKCRKKMRKTPFNIIEKDGKRYALMGIEKIPLIYEMEICPTFCMCSDKYMRFTHLCGPGEMCFRTGCRVPRLSAQLTRITVSEFPLDQISIGSATTDIFFEVRYQGKPLLKDIFKKNIQILVKDIIIPENYYKLDIQDFKWHLKLNIPKFFASEISPGKYDIYVRIRYEDNFAVFIAPIEIWYSATESVLKAKITGIDPATISSDTVIHGAYIKIYLSLLDTQERPIRGLERRDVQIRMDDKELPVYSLKYIAALRQWVITAVIRGRISPGRKVIKLDVNLLGKTGESGYNINIIPSGKTYIDIVQVSPGTYSDPIYQIMQREGFDLDVIVSIKGKDIIPISSIMATIKDDDGNELIDKIKPLYVTSSQLGYIIHFSNINLCSLEEDIIGWKWLYIEFKYNDNGEESIKTAERPILFRPNPGGWSSDKKCQ